MKLRVYAALFILVALLGFVILKVNNKSQTRDLAQQEDILDTATSNQSDVTNTEAPTQLEPSVLNSEHLRQALDISRYSSETQKKLNILNEIISSKNDNDPRLDQDLKVLTEEDKTALKELYESTKKESLNERGLVIFLISRNLSTPEDFGFVKQIVSEEPCLSLANCNTREVSQDPHMQGIETSTLNYPQNVALEGIRRLSKQGTENLNETVKQHMKEILEQAKNFPNPAISHKAQSILDNTKL